MSGLKFIIRAELDKTANGVIQNNKQTFVKVNGKPVAVKGSQVGLYEMAEGSSVVKINNDEVCRVGDEDTDNKPAFNESPEPNVRLV